MNKAFIFPGQGSQKVGMGKEVYDNFSNARLIFEEVDNSLNYHLSKVIFEGPKEKLTLTENAQPAIMTVSIALLTVLVKDFNIDIKKNIKFMAGHSLGEYTALAASKSLEIADVAKLLKARGASMQKAVPLNKGSMAAFMGAGIDEIRDILVKNRKNLICDIANHNTKLQVVISGDVDAVDNAIAMAKEKNIRSIKLPVSAPFHCAHMKKTAEDLKTYFNKLNFQIPEVDIISNFSANVVESVGELKEVLYKQTFSTVKWYESMLLMKSFGINHCFEIGYGKVLSGINKRIDKDFKTTNSETILELEQIAKLLA